MPSRSFSIITLSGYLAGRSSSSTLYAVSYYCLTLRWMPQVETTLRFQSSWFVVHSFPSAWNFLEFCLYDMVRVFPLFNRHCNCLSLIALLARRRQALLWHSYRLASRPESSLLAATVSSVFARIWIQFTFPELTTRFEGLQEQSATFATVLSLALTVKPVTDLV